MKKPSFIDIIKQKIAAIAFRIFLWGNSTTKEQYWQDIYEQEFQFRITDVDEYQ